VRVDWWRPSGRCLSSAFDVAFATIYFLRQYIHFTYLFFACYLKVAIKPTYLGVFHMKATILALPMKGDYARWGAPEALREFLQNARDAHTDGHAMSVSFDDDTDTMVIFNDGSTISREAGLVLGSTTKRDDASKIGYWGEGGKLAAGTLISLGMTTEINNGLGELWTFRLKHNDDFGTEMLHVHIVDTDVRDGVRIKIAGLDKADYAIAVERCRWLNDDAAADVYASSLKGSMLKGEANAGKLFVKGIWVCELPDGPWTFGYDLNDINLDRDRRIADPWTLKRKIREVISCAASDGTLSADELWHIFKGESAEAQSFNNPYIDSNAVHDAVFASFVSEHGEDARPVSTGAELEKARQCGLKPIVVTPAQKVVLEAKMGKLSDALAERSFAVQEYLSEDDLDEIELKNLNLVKKLIRMVEPWAAEVVRPVSFYGSNILGRYSMDSEGDVTIQMSCTSLMKKSRAISTLVHEAAHKYGDDGTAEHRAAEERIFGDIIAELI